MKYPDIDPSWPKRIAKIILWTLTTIIVMFIAAVMFFMSWAIGMIFPLTELPRVLQLVLLVFASALGGAIVGSAQWLVLSSQVRWGRRWFWATVSGWTTGGVVWGLEYFLLGGDQFSVSLSSVGALLVVTGFVSGLAIGLAQWLVMSETASIFILWVPSSAIGWSVGAGAGYIVMNTTDFGMLTYLVPMVVTGGVVGVITGIMMDVLTHRALSFDSRL